MSYSTVNLPAPEVRRSAPQPVYAGVAVLAVCAAFAAVYSMATVAPTQTWVTVTPQTAVGPASALRAAMPSSAPAAFRPSSLAAVQRPMHAEAAPIVEHAGFVEVQSQSPTARTQTGAMALVFAVSSALAALGAWFHTRKAPATNITEWAMASSAAELGMSEEEFEDALKKGMALVQSAINDHKVILFMKGVPTAPQCGFSAGTVEILNQYPETKWVACNVFQDPMIREGVKRVGQWPTIPQLYVDGELIGGYDIVSEMHKSGELKACLPANAPAPDAPAE